jgi:hypothetical protein
MIFFFVYKSKKLYILALNIYYDCVYIHNYIFYFLKKILCVKILMGSLNKK